MSLGRSDPTCLPLGLLGERFFASGDERTPMPTTGMYGYHVGWLDTWAMNYELANHTSAAQDVVIEMTYEWVPDDTPGMQRVDPVWLDITPCTSYTSIAAGPTTQTWDWAVNRPGRVVGLGGHLHDGGVDITVRNESTGRLLCDSRPGYGESPLYIGHHGDAHLSSMSICRMSGSTPIDTLAAGQRVRLQSHYNSPTALTDAMGIVIMYVAPR
jgi:hypothetical protein